MYIPGQSVPADVGRMEDETQRYQSPRREEDELYQGAIREKDELYPRPSMMPIEESDFSQAILQEILNEQTKDQTRSSFLI